MAKIREGNSDVGVIGTSMWQNHNKNLIQLKAFQWAAKNKEDSMDFKAIVSWCSRFRHRHDLVIHQKTKIAQQLLKDLDHKIT